MVPAILKTRIEVVSWVLVACCACDTDGILISQDCRQEQRPCWENLGLADQRVEALASTPWGLYAATRQGVFQLNNAGAWVQRGLSDHFVSSIIFVPRNDGYLLAGVRPVATETTAAAVFASHDSGQSWLPSDGGLAASYDSRFWAYALVADPLDPSHILWAASSPILRSEDGGTTWEFVVGSIARFGQGVNEIELGSDTLSGAWVVGAGAFGEGYVRRSMDRGRTWELLLPLGEAEIPALSIDPDPAVPGRVWLGMRGGIMRSDDLGESWTVALKEAGRVNAIVAVNDVLYAATSLPDDAGRTDALGLFRLEPGSAEWTPVPVPESRGALTMIASDSRDILIGTTNSGVWLYRTMM